jgi:hypothetical protein
MTASEKMCKLRRGKIICQSTQVAQQRYGNPSFADNFPLGKPKLTAAEAAAAELIIQMQCIERQ